MYFGLLPVSQNEICEAWGFVPAELGDDGDQIWYLCQGVLQQGFSWVFYLSQWIHENISYSALPDVNNYPISLAVCHYRIARSVGLSMLIMVL